MSELDDLDDIVETPPRDRDGKPGRIASGFAASRKFKTAGLKMLEERNAPGNRLRLSGNIPSLPKLKFMGEK